MTTPSHAKIAAGLIAIYLIWGSTYLAIRVAVETLPPFLMAGSRFVIAGTVLAAILVAKGRFQATRAQWLWNVNVGLWLLLGGNGLVTWAEQSVPSGLATLIVATNPLMIVAAEWVMYRWSRQQLGSTPNRAVLLGIALGLIGLVILVAPSLFTPQAVHVEGQANLGGEHLLTPQNIVSPIGIGAIVIACLAWTVGSAMTRYARQPVDPFSGAAIQMLGGGAAMVLLGLIVGEHQHADFSGASTRSWIAWVYLITAGSLIAFTTFVWLMKHASPTLVSTYGYVNPIVAVILGWLVLDETIDAWTILSAAFIIAGVAMISLQKSKKPT